MFTERKRCLAVCFLALLVATSFSTQTARAGAIYDVYNELLSPGPFFWAPPSGNIGWYWTPSTDVELSGIQTKLASGFSNINNNFVFTTTFYSDRPAAGGTSMGSFNWHGTTFVDGSWLGGNFATPLTLTGGQTYFVGMSGWEQGLAFFGGTGGSGVNWIDPPNQPGAETIGIGSGYVGVNYEVQMNTGSTAANIDSPIIRFIGTPVPEPGTLALVSMGVLAIARRRR